MQTVANTVKKIMIKEPFYGLFLCGVNKKFSDTCPSACVGLHGINVELEINKAFWDSLTNPNYRYALLKHEILHICFGHITDLYDYDPDLKNLGMDLEVESYIDPSMWIRDDKGKLKLSADWLFDKFPHLNKELGTKKYMQILKEMKEMTKGKQNPDADIQKDYDNLSEEDKIQLDKVLHNPPKHNFTILSADPQMKKLVQNQIAHLVKQTAQNLSRGTIPQEMKQIIKELLNPKPPIFNWKAFFRRLLGVSYDIYPKKTRRKESNRFPDSPGLKKNKKHNILVGIDTSGSVSDKDYVDFFSEIHNIYKAGANIHILECDSRISAEYDYKGKMPQYRSSCGGTSFTPVVDYYNQHKRDYATCVYLTDGYGDQDYCHPNGKMIWIITSDGNKESEFPGFKVCIPQNY